LAINSSDNVFEKTLDVSNFAPSLNIHVQQICNTVLPFLKNEIKFPNKFYYNWALPPFFHKAAHYCQLVGVGGYKEAFEKKYGTILVQFRLDSLD
jgi:hypothetical protein